jgi:class 3 adenylate cyclase/ActR/RegA family two-component response regulator
MMSSEETKKRILIVDDSFIMRKLIREIVESDDDLTVVDVAENGQIALQKVREVKPDLVLLDIEMPEMSGLETLRRLGLRSKSKVVILSSLGGEGTAETIEALRLGAAAVLEKPSGSISLDVQARKGAGILSTIRNVLGLPPRQATAVPVEAVVAAVAEAAGITDEALFRDALLGALGSGVMVFDGATRLTICNAAAARLMGRSAPGPASVTLDELFDEYNEGLGADIRSVLGSGEKLPPFTTAYALPDGGWQPIRLAVLPLARANGDKGLLVLMDDLSREQEIKRLLSNTMSSDVAAKLLEDGVSLGGTLEQASILFSDIRGFTNLSEELGAAGIVKLLNEYFSYMEDILKSEGGVIDKYIGDAIMALFGVPARLGNDADRAVRGGLGMLAALDVLNRDREAQNQSPVKIGIGIGTGKVVAGNIGSPSRMNYTVIGDPVNLAARIESLTKQYGAELIICEATKQALEQPIASRKLDWVRVKGQTSATILHEVLRPSNPADPAWLEAYAAGFDAYTSGRWSDAVAHLHLAIVLNPNDKAAKLIMDRCRTLQSVPPTDWDGVWTHQEK